MKIKKIKAYIKTNLANRFIKFFKLLSGLPIFFNYKFMKTFVAILTIMALLIWQKITSTFFSWLANFKIV